jgi:hypothetical protein
MKCGTPESAVLSACLRLLTLRRVLHWRNAAVPVPLKGGGYRRYSGLRGLADICFLLPPRGRLVACECKSSVGRQSADQRTFQRAVEAAGGLYLLVDDVRKLAFFLDAQEKT